MTQLDQPSSHDSNRKRVSVTLPKALIEEAKAMKINMSKTAEMALAAEMKRRKEAQWLEENADFIAAYNKRIEEHGVAFRPIWELRAESEDGQI